MKLKILVLLFVCFATPYSQADAKLFRVVVSGARLLPVKTSGNCWDICQSKTARKLVKLAKQLRSVNSFAAKGVTSKFAAVTRKGGSLLKGARMPDPFVRVRFAKGQTLKTHAVKNTISPMWGTSEQVSLKPYDKISIQIWDKDLRSHDLIGEMPARRIPARYFKRGGTWRVRFHQVYELTMLFIPLKSPSISKFQPGTYRITLHGADIMPQKLSKQYWDPFRGKPDPYMALQIGNRKIKTPALRNTLAPRWNYSFKMFLNGGERFFYSVYDKDLSKDDLIGNCTYQQVSHLLLRYSKYYRRQCQRVSEVRISFELLR